MIKPDNHKNQANSFLAIMVTNCRSLFPKLTGLVQNFSALSWQMCLLTETWEPVTRTDGQKIALDCLKNQYGLDYIGSPRSHRKGGGVAIMFDIKKITMTKVSVIPPKRLELIVGLIKTIEPCAFPVQIAISAYFPPVMSKDQIKISIEYLQKLVSDLNNKYGDIPFIFGADKNRVSIEDILTIHPDFAALNNEPTRGRNCLDIMVTNFTNFYEMG